MDCRRVSKAHTKPYNIISELKQIYSTTTAMFAVEFWFEDGDFLRFYAEEKKA